MVSYRCACGKELTSSFFFFYFFMYLNEDTAGTSKLHINTSQEKLFQSRALVFKVWSPNSITWEPVRTTSNWLNRNSGWSPAIFLTSPPSDSAASSSLRITNLDGLGLTMTISHKRCFRSAASTPVQSFY